MEKLTPMLKQYMEVKEANPDALVMFRLGDFYELFFEDAKIASLELDLVLTGRAAGDNQRAPMCGVPHHAAGGYIQKLVDRGFKVAIVEQMEDPATAVGLVKRDVVKIVTPGTMVDELIEDKDRHYIASIEHFAGAYTLLLCELISGQLELHAIKADGALLKATIMKYQIRELVTSSHLDARSLQVIRSIPYLTLSYCDEVEIDEGYLKQVHNISDEQKRRVYGRLLQYLLRTQKRSLYHLKEVVDTSTQKFMRMDYGTMLNLELVEALRNQGKNNTLFSFLDQCKTSMGSRLLKDWIMHPLYDLDKIINRQDQIEHLLKDFIKYDRLQERLKLCYDVQRLVGRVSFGSANPQDLMRLRQTLNQVPEILSLLDASIFNPLNRIDPLSELTQILNDALNDELPPNLKDGNVFRHGYHEQLDELRDIQNSGQKWLLDFEAQERERTQIKNLKIGYNRVFGYYIEVSKGNIPMIKDEFMYVRKQTLSNQERFITPELKEMEDKILHAYDRSLKLEQDLFNALIERIRMNLFELQAIADALSHFDVVSALCRIAKDHHYVKPSFHEGFDCVIKEARHPILETKTKYVSNSTEMHQAQMIHILTGPNMGGKSTYMRQFALVIILAQMGSYVPAKKADLPLIDALFTRMGASDDILSGQSTFMVEMIEANTALQNATKDSLVLFDEIGRGTSTFDGMALAQAMVEYLATVVKCKTIFSTHYHELTQLEHSLPQVKNMHVEVFEENNEVTFLYRVKHGRADRSYGVNVARLAHLPNAIIDRAGQLITELESKKRVVQQSMAIVEMVTIPKALQQVESDLKQIDINQTTPLEAWAYLDAWKKQMKD
jgi:DNA mismatch repair protein MutS